MISRPALATAPTALVLCLLGACAGETTSPAAMGPPAPSPVGDATDAGATTDGGDGEAPCPKGSGGMDACWNQVHLVVALVPGEGNTADAGARGEGLGTIRFRRGSYDGPGGDACAQRPSPAEIGVGCTRVLSAVPSDPLDVTVVVTTPAGVEAEKRVTLRPFNYCGRDIAYEVVAIPAAGAPIFHATRYITPCAMPKRPSS